MVGSRPAVVDTAVHLDTRMLLLQAAAAQTWEDACSSSRREAPSRRPAGQ